MKTAIASKFNSLTTRITLLVASMLTIMASATIAPSLPAMLKHFESVPNSAYWVRLVLTLPALFIAISAPILGILVDSIGRKPLLLIALIVYGLAGSSGLWLESLETIIIGRALLGVSVAGIMIATTVLIADLGNSNQYARQRFRWFNDFYIFRSVFITACQSAFEPSGRLEWNL